MDSWKLKTFRDDLSRFIEIIANHGVTGDFSELAKVLDELDLKSLIEYKITGLCFYINGRIVGTVPNDMNYCQIYFDNMLMVRDPLEENLDPLHAYDFNISVEVYKNRTSTTKGYFSSWHLDRHPDTQNVKYTHPTYHFTFGGKKMEYLDPDMSILSCPRIPHPPMDIFLGFHFILSNYFNNRHFSFVNDLLADYDYQQIIKRAQERLWKPYFMAFDGANTHSDFIISKVFPLYIN